MQTINYIELPLSIDVVSQLYCCHEQLPKWSPGFISLELIEENHGDIGSVYEQRYMFQDKEIIERITILAIELPHRLHLLSQGQSNLSRESLITFDAIDDSQTKMTVENQFRGELVEHLNEGVLSGYTQHFLEVFRTFALRGKCETS
jgi:hypothetical protein